LIIGIGVDVVEVTRFEESLRRTPALAGRLFTDAERVLPDGRPRTARSLAARFAAKEAAAKALGAPAGLAWHDAEVVVAVSGRPSLRVTGTVAAAAGRAGVAAWHLSLSHDGDVAVATVVAEG
jgi:holo-[acyl-carrier protein] synthase